ncbi:hypothetical protein FQN49_006823, partial [Arthroderma sp. PD_2]
MASVPGPDYRSIINSPQFTFLIGPAHSKLTIQSGLAKHVSPRLDGLMNNGHTRESRHRIAVLEEEDVETFTGFCEFAYTGDYTVPSRPTKPEQTDDSVHGEPTSPLVHAHIPPPAPSPPSSPKGPRPEDSCAVWDDEDDLPKQEPVLPVVVKEDPPPQPQEEEEEPKGAIDSGKKGKKGKKEKKGKKKAVEERPAASTLTPPKTPPPVESKDESKNESKDEIKDAVVEEKDNQIILAEAPSQPEERPMGQLEENANAGDWFDFKPPQDAPLVEAPKSEGSVKGEPFFTLPSSRPAGISLWDEFTAIQYPQYERRGSPSNSSPTMNEASRAEAPYILYHAKIYVFASRYLVPTLAQLALTKLHRDLVSFPLRTTNASGHGDNSTVPLVLELLHYT